MVAFLTCSWAGKVHKMEGKGHDSTRKISVQRCQKLPWPLKRSRCPSVLWGGGNYQSVQSHWAGDNCAGPSLAYPLLSSGQPCLTDIVLVSKTLPLLESNKTRWPYRGKVSGIWKMTINWQLRFWSPFDQHFSFESSRSCYNLCVKPEETSWLIPV